MNLSNLSLSDNFISKAINEYYTLQYWSGIQNFHIPNIKSSIVFYTNGNFIQASDASDIEVTLCQMSTAFSDAFLAESKDPQHYLFSTLMSHIKKLDNEMMKLTYGEGYFAPVIGPILTEENAFQFMTIVKYSVGGWCQIDKEVYYEAQKNQQNKML